MVGLRPVEGRGLFEGLNTQGTVDMGCFAL